MTVLAATALTANDRFASLTLPSAAGWRESSRTRLFQSLQSTEASTEDTELVADTKQTELPQSKVYLRSSIVHTEM